ncbi:HAD family hydrolase [Romboutsia maritimum]|uniref:D-glycero-alpha-D-manno-heptose-1,7-bisphosphate 7-phosphatase n=1 Tax=Romboutsia maritimum TaxID=2020948 RepID=A0A371IS04_9FIRM|nr:HAD family hydrolase [Romboutsia maritimum]RDY23266.1 HAD family hydrolase [Romboutsia maritimum]
MNKAVFFDRDGTINVEKNYLYKVEDFEFIKGIPQIIKKFNDDGYKVIVITNQAGIGRGYYTEEDMHKLHKHIDSELKKYDAHIDAYYFCPHHPVHGIGEYKLDCNCRKPKTGMLEKAIDDFDIDVKQSILYGDKPWDIEAGKNIGVSSYYIDEIL